MCGKQVFIGSGRRQLTGTRAVRSYDRLWALAAMAGEQALDDVWACNRPIDPLVLQQYRSAYEIDRREREEYERRRDEALPKAFDLRIIDKWHSGL
jgi:hypothetical protein